MEKNSRLQHKSIQQTLLNSSHVHNAQVLQLWFVIYSIGILGRPDRFLLDLIISFQDYKRST